jgi:hypothetical protein
MTIFTQAQGTRSTTVLNLGTLASATYVASSAIDLGASIPLDVTFEVVCKPNGSPTGNKQLVLFAQLSLDNSAFTTGPISGTTTTDENQLHWIGTLPVTTSAQDHRKMFSLSGLPVTRYLKLVAKNDMGVALTSGDVFRADITGAA